MPARMTPRSWVQGATNAANCTLGLVAVVALGGVFLAWATGLSTPIAAASAFGAVLLATNLEVWSEPRWWGTHGYPTGAPAGPVSEQ
jgi:hypothetical protein